MKLEDYKNAIRSAFPRHARRGMINATGCDKLYDVVSETIDAAEKSLLPEGKYADLFTLCNWTFRMWSRFEMDDFYGQTGYLTFNIAQLWDTIYRDGQESLPHDEMLTSLLETASDNVKDNMQDTIFDFLVLHFKSPEELARKEEFFSQKIESMKRETPPNDYLSLAEAGYMQILYELSRPIEQIRAVVRPGDLPVKTIKLGEIEAAYGNFPEAVDIFKKVIGDNPHPSESIRTNLMRAYQGQGKKSAYHYELLMLMLDYPEDLRYYQEYKRQWSETEWKKRWENILSNYPDKLPSIVRLLQEEGRYDLIMEAAEPADASIVKRFQEELFALYPERCLKVWEADADHYAAEAKNRSDYESLASRLKNIATHPGGEELAKELAAKYKKQYPRKKALIEELSIF